MFERAAIMRGSARYTRSDLRSYSCSFGLRTCDVSSQIILRSSVFVSRLCYGPAQVFRAIQLLIRVLLELAS